MNLRKAAEMALEALDCLPWQASPIAVEATKALRQALDKPEIELKVLVDMAVLAEREACANVADVALLGAERHLRERVVRAIRARGGK